MHVRARRKYPIVMIGEFMPAFLGANGWESEAAPFYSWYAAGSCCLELMPRKSGVSQRAWGVLWWAVFSLQTPAGFDERASFCPAPRSAPWLWISPNGIAFRSAPFPDRSVAEFVPANRSAIGFPGRAPEAQIG